MDENQSNELNLILQTINQIESQIKIDEWTFRGMGFWPIFKIKLYWQKGLHISPNRKIQLKLVWSYIYNGLTDFFMFLLSLKNLRRAEFVISSNLSNRRFKVDDRFFDYYGDPIASELNTLGKKVVFFEINPNDITYWQKSPSFSNTLKLNFIRKVVFLIAKIYVPSELKKRIKNNITSDLAQLNVSNHFAKTVGQNIWAEYLYSKIIKFFLKLINPNFVFGVCYYSKWGEIFSCNQMGITYVDIQHGAQGKGQPAYSHWHFIQNTLPNLYWVWSENEKKNVMSWRGRTFLGLNPFQRLIKKHPRILDKDIQKLKSLHNRDLAGVTITLQPGVNFQYLKDLSNSPNYFFYVKLHPLMSTYEKMKVKKTLEKNHLRNFDWRTTSDCSIQACLAASKLHLTVDSYAVSEAADIGINSICLGAHSLTILANYIQSGKAHYLPDFNNFSKFAETLLAEPNLRSEIEIPDLQLFI